MQRSLLLLLVATGLILAGAAEGALGFLIAAGVVQQWRRRAGGSPRAPNARLARRSANETPSLYLVRSQLWARAP